MRAIVIEAKCGAKEVAAGRPPVELLTDLQVFHDGWQAMARRETSLLYGKASCDTGKGLEYEENQLASLVVEEAARPSFVRSVATTWCVRRLRNVAKEWAPTGHKRLGKWMARLEQTC